MDPTRSRAPLGRVRALAVLAATVVAATTIAIPASAASGGFRTTAPSMLDKVRSDVSIVPILTVGDAVGDDGYTADSLMDGISFTVKGKGRVDVYLNHETSLVPFPVTPELFSDYTNAQVSRIALNQNSMGALNAEYVIPSSANYQRFCSNFLATAAQGFDRDILFANEEATDTVNRTGTAFPLDAGGSNPEQGGVVVAYDVKSGAYKTIYGMGRHNHENSVAIPGYEDLVILSGDDTFSAPASQLYSYIAADTNAVWNDQGALWAFAANPGTDLLANNDYSDVTGTEEVSGRFIEVPKAIAQGPQGPLETWSNANEVFQFIRVEDIAYDRTNSNIVYFADTGEPRAKPGATAAARMTREASSFQGPFPNGRVWKMVLNQNDPKVVDSLSILIDADAGGYGAYAGVIHQPDNIETTANSLLIQEDPGGHNQFSNGPQGSTARIWRYDLSDKTLEVVAKVNQSLDESAIDTDTYNANAARAGAWESSGIIDASAAFGPGWFLVDIQAGSLILKNDKIGATRFELEGGQLLAIRIPGA
ncbi:MAG: hypothetical protein H0U52_01890 [Chloroflexi bacterium]|nr:hypothetical protein [Chloroflexota bacterium]